MRDNKKTIPGNKNARQPLFNGDYRRDTAVAEFEKAAEISYAIRMAIDRLQERRRNKEGQAYDA